MASEQKFDSFTFGRYVKCDRCGAVIMDTDWTPGDEWFCACGAHGMAGECYVGCQFCDPFWDDEESGK